LCPVPTLHPSRRCEKKAKKEKGGAYGSGGAGSSGSSSGQRGGGGVSGGFLSRHGGGSGGNSGPEDVLELLSDLREFDVAYSMRAAIDLDLRCGTW